MSDTGDVCLTQVTQLRFLEELDLSECFLLPNMMTKREALPEGLGVLPLTRLRLAPYAFGAELDRHGFADDPLREMSGLTRLRELELERVQVPPLNIHTTLFMPDEQMMRIRYSEAVLLLCNYLACACSPQCLFSTCSTTRCSPRRSRGAWTRWRP